MNDYLNIFGKYIVSVNATFLDVIKLIDNNKKRFAVVLKKDIVVGVLTDEYTDYIGRLEHIKKTA